jgi:hypothetical protein
VIKFALSGAEDELPWTENELRECLQEVAEDLKGLFEVDEIFRTGQPPAKI